MSWSTPNWCQGTQYGGRQVSPIYEAQPAQDTQETSLNSPNDDQQPGLYVCHHLWHPV